MLHSTVTILRPKRARRCVIRKPSLAGIAITMKPDFGRTFPSDTGFLHDLWLQPSHREPRIGNARAAAGGDLRCEQYGRPRGGGSRRSVRRSVTPGCSSPGERAEGVREGAFEAGRDAPCFREPRPPGLLLL